MYVLLVVVCPFVLFLLAIVLSFLLRYTDSDYPFGIFKLFIINVRLCICYKTTNRLIVMYYHLNKRYRILKCQYKMVNPEKRATQWPKEKVQKDKQRFTKHIYKTKGFHTKQESCK